MSARIFVAAAFGLAGAWLLAEPAGSRAGDDAKTAGPKELGPEDYLKLLQKRFKDNPSYNLGLEGPSLRTVKEEDVPKLIKLFDSKEKCAATMAAGSAVYAAEGSTVGHEAAVLVDSLPHGEGLSRREHLDKAPGGPNGSAQVVGRQAERAEVADLSRTKMPHPTRPQRRAGR